MTTKREERAIDMVGAIAPLVGLLPDTVLESMAGSIVNSDVQASNVPVYAGDTYIAGAKVLRQYGLGPLPGGVAMMVVLVSRSGGYCTITSRYDRAAITDQELWARCLLAGFDEVLALGGRGPRRTRLVRHRPGFTRPVTQWECSAMTSPNGQPAQRTMRLPGSVAEILGSRRAPPGSEHSSISTAPWSPGSPAW